MCKKDNKEQTFVNQYLKRVSEQPKINKQMQQAQDIGRSWENKPQWNKLWIDHFPSCVFAMPSISIDEWWSDRLTPFTDQK